MDEETKKENKEPEEAVDELAKCQKEKDEYLDGWKRAKADLINYKKDEAKRFESVIKFSNESIIRDLINVLDSFDLALVSLQEDGDQKKEKGLYLIRQQLEDILKQNGLERIIVSEGQPFDPALQEAIASVESEKESGTIIEEVEKGYLLNGRLIRPARVKVAK
jgi:molecular chaperone GrpE